MILSIVIPVYNVERYIGRCLASCVQQDIPMSDYEIIVVNDGTPDNSMKIVQTYAQSHANIVVFEQENKGLSEARNAGLRLAKGDYVWFVDSDDWIETNCLKALSERIRNNHLDALHISAINVSNGKQALRFDYSSLDFSVWKGKDVLSRIQFQYPAQFTIYKREFLQSHRLTFYPKIYHEDMEFTPRAYYFAERVSYYTSPIYFYELGNASSIMHNVSIKRVVDMSLILQRHLRFIEQEVKEKECMPAFGTIIGQLLSNSLMVIKHIGDTSHKKSYMQFINDHKTDIVTLMRHCTNPYFRFESYILGLSTPLFIYYYYLVHLNR